MSGYRAFEAGVPQGIVLGSHRCSVYTTNIPRQEGTIPAQYAYDTAMG